VAQIAITDQVLRRVIPAAGGRLEIWDIYVEGFAYRATRRGHGSFFVRFRLNGQRRRLTIGHYPAVSLEAARTAAHELLESARAGIDPAIAQRAAADAARGAAEATERDRGRTVALAVNDFLRLYRRYRPSTRAEVGRLLKRELVSRLGTVPVSGVDRRAVAGVINAVADLGHGTTANRLFAYLQTFFRWLVERGELEATPMVNLSKPAAERSRDRALTDAELAAVWEAAVARWLACARKI
jgi:hypothetical protein